MFGDPGVLNGVNFQDASSIVFKELVSLLPLLVGALERGLIPVSFGVVF